MNAEYNKKNDKWGFYIDNSIDFLTSIADFPLDLKKSYIDQLCEIDKTIRKYVYNISNNKGLAKMLQELDYIK